MIVMIKPAQHAAVVMWLGTNSIRPLKAMRLWALLLEHLYPRTGQIMLTCDQIAEKIGIRPTEVSEIMGGLVSCRAIFTEHRDLEGVQGPDRVVYFMNKHIAQVGSQLTEEELRLVPRPSFASRVIEGGQQSGGENPVKGVP
jgi:hypothetical protein